MLTAAAQLVPYAALAALSPFALAATITVLHTGRSTAVGFALGVLGGQLLALSALVVLGGVATRNRSTAHPTFERLLELAVGSALIVLAVHLRRHPGATSRTSNGRSQAVLERLRRVHFLTAASLGLVLGIGGPKRLLLAALASASITATGITGTDEVLLVCWYTLLATALVWLSVVAYVVFGDRAVALLDATLAWLARHRRQATFYTLIIVGLALLVEGALLL
jgi:hypothetical protein